jgi:hypothetical protein
MEFTAMMPLEVMFTTTICAPLPSPDDASDWKLLVTSVVGHRIGDHSQQEKCIYLTFREVSQQVRTAAIQQHNNVKAAEKHMSRCPYTQCYPLMNYY